MLIEEAERIAEIDAANFVRNAWRRDDSGEYRLVEINWTGQELPSGGTVKFLDDNSMYLGNQVECELREGRCYGMVACSEFLLVCEYGENSADSEIVVYKRR